jgi:CNT family concentrative nucleoside transporter
LIAGLILLKLPVFRQFFMILNDGVMALEAATTAGTSFVFGYLGGAALPFAEAFPGASFILAFRALPLVLVISALSALLFHWRVLPLVVRGFSWCLRKTMGLGGAEGLGVSANVFVGMVESPLFVRPYLEKMTRSELFTLMTAGMATIAGTVMVLYASILGDAIPGVMGHILTASIISVPAAVTVAKVMVPETASPTSGELVTEHADAGSDGCRHPGYAPRRRTADQHHVAMLIVLVALVHLVNTPVGSVSRPGRAAHHPPAGVGGGDGTVGLVYGGALAGGAGGRKPHGR